MIERLKKIQEKYLRLDSELSTASDPNKLKELYKERSRLTPVYNKTIEFLKISSDIEDAKNLLPNEKDEDMHEMLKSEIRDGENRLDELAKELEIMLLPPDPNSGKNILIEIRAGTGGEESGLFCADLFRMYSRYADKVGIRADLIDSSPTGIGGFKEIVFALEDERAYDLFKFEAGTHRVQRIPATESGGRIHTSAVTVAVLPEAEEKEVDIKDSDIRVDVFRSSGSGGQHVNTTDSAVRLTHIPTGIVVSCQDEKSQIKNRDKAMRILRARIIDQQIEEAKTTSDAIKKQMIGSGDRSERIRTYNFPQGRCTDHRIGFTSHNLSSIMEGDMDELIEALLEEDRAKRLAATK
ncbi:peptide chain release factor 1 [Leptospira sp. GIMC2001]|uniref:peptide chain release factor 1 n=1 Tax=Leptospira sp. GIMC2001 TaxID=1513297 RepID=UPI00234A1CCF|nr:peptide chain release factor 1 [Leptospira sp. GIMC2001]WCL49420.1 peptide chain release factor 1 [Leptospira sp. GIMC2001]